MLCSVVAKNLKDSKESTLLTKQLTELLDNIANKVSSPEIWSVYAKFYEDIGDSQKSLEFREKQYRATQSTSWESDAKLFEAYATATFQLCKCYIAEGSSKSLFASRTKLRGLIKKTEDTFSNLPIYKQLEELLLSVPSNS